MKLSGSNAESEMSFDARLVVKNLVIITQNHQNIVRTITAGTITSTHHYKGKLCDG